ncbi:hypothetical protein FVEG_12370 [Fusarium verticillioides 7600]|uniref:Uncharacterized protein n=1 Tax=Gibberella moniliformis (strain M3125 / FGSC 7600) TaxID=334819 RepID=W7NC71_GIBM7|nr:hypothetical protein FVEG_12370 [Fusarium verticillioides 7600]EWG54072.1 hypothetical protein FVEG_12370 [Fusarium verticillioides 7600]
MSQPPTAKSTHIHTIWGRRPMSTIKNRIALFVPMAEFQLQEFIEKHKLRHIGVWDDGLRLTIPLDNKTPQKALADLTALMEIGRLDKYYEFVAKATENPEKKLNQFIVKHKICWNSKWDNKLRLTIELPSNKSPEETVGDFCALMQDEGLDKYWEYVTQAHTDDPNKVDPRVYKNDQDLEREALANNS